MARTCTHLTATLAVAVLLHAGSDWLPAQLDICFEPRLFKPVRYGGKPRSCVRSHSAQTRPGIVCQSQAVVGALAAVIC